jgi:DNA segregation ATPase FtsK/SpoIIIE-like protein
LPCSTGRIDPHRPDSRQGYVGIEVPNQKRETIQIREVVESKKFKESTSLLTIALGKTIDGLNYVADLAKCRTF